MYKICFSRQPIKPLTSFSLLGFLLTLNFFRPQKYKFCLSFHVRVKFLTPINLLSKVLLDLILVLSELVTPGVLQVLESSRVGFVADKRDLL